MSYARIISGMKAESPNTTAHTPRAPKQRAKPRPRIEVKSERSSPKQSEFARAIMNFKGLPKRKGKVVTTETVRALIEREV